MILTEADKSILPLIPRNIGGFHQGTRWYLNNWEPMPWQWAWHQLEVLNTTIIAGIATGKTAIVTASNLMDCISQPWFRALNTSVTAKQAELPFNMAMGWIEDNNRIEKFVKNISLRPFPVITFKNGSEYHFRTAGVDGRFIRGFEYDRANFDEAGLDLVGYIIKILRGRLRGTRPDGITRMARLDVTSSPTASLWLRERFDRGNASNSRAELELYRSIRRATWENSHLTKEQVDAMIAEYPAEMIDVELGGAFPDFGGSMFPLGHLEWSTDQSLYDAAYIALHPEADFKTEVLPGYVLEEDMRHGVIHFELPNEPGHIYVEGGDPGTGGYPARNAPVVMVADITKKPYKLVYVDWGSGHGSYNPFLTSYKYAINKYSPIFKGIDATGTQAGIDEIAFTNMGIQTERINFTRDKTPALNQLVVDVTNHFWKWAPIKGLLNQMSTYTLENDKAGLPQDLVMTMAELSFLAAFAPQESIQNIHATHATFRKRNRRSSRRR
jgi:hypothetical protein